jgi:hypothetical protein
MTADKVLLRLRAGGQDGPGHALAELLVDHTLDRTVEARINAGWLTHAARLVAKGWDDARLEVFFTAQMLESAQRAAQLKGSVASHAPPGALKALQAALAVPVSLDAQLLMRVVDQPQIRALIQDMLQLVLADFVKKASTPLSQSRVVSGVLSRARGMMQGSVAGGLLSAVGEGLSAEAERRVREYSDEAVSQVLSRVVNQLCDPRHAQAYGALRAGMVQSAADADVASWTRQVVATQPVPTVVTLLRTLREHVATPAFETWLAQHLGLWTPVPGTTLRAWLDQAGLLGTVRSTAVELLRQELDEVVATHAFALWLHRLLEDGDDGEVAPRKPASKPARARKKGA